MPSETYSIRYTTPNIANAKREIEALRAAIVELDKEIDKSAAKLADLGKNVGGLNAFRTALTGTAAAFKTMDGIASNTAAVLETVGKNTSGLTRTRTKVETLNAELAKTPGLASSANAGLSGMGGGVGGGGGIGGFGGTSFGGTVRRAVTNQAIRGMWRKITESVDTMGESAGEASQTAESRAHMSQAFRASLREVASLEGKNTVDDEMVRDQLKFIEETGSSPQEALNFRSVFKGAMGSSILEHQTTGGKRGMTKQTAEELMPEAMKFAARTEMDTETAAKMFGLLGLYQGVPNKEAAMKTAGLMQGHLNIEGVGTMKQLGRPFFGLMGELTGDGGRISDPVRLAATFAVATAKAKSPSIAATEIRQANRGLQKLANQNMFGLTPEMDYSAQIRALAPQFAGVDRTTQTAALKAAGLGNELEISSIIKRVSESNLVEAAMKSPDVLKFGDQAMKLNQEYMNSEVGQTYQAEAKMFSAEIQKGMPLERVERLRTKARTERLKSGQSGTVSSGIAERMVALANPFMGVSGELELTDRQVMEDLYTRSKKVGYDLFGQHPELEHQDVMVGKPFGRGPWSEERRRSEFANADAAIQKLEQAANGLNAAAGALQQALPAGRPPGNAAAVPMRP